MWVEIHELNDQGHYVPVTIEGQKNVGTGGIYILQQVIILRLIILYHLK